MKPEPRRSIPRVTYDVDLPILGHRDEILSALRSERVVIVAGETGSGKSTQLPKMCLEAGFGTRGLIGHTQPRRIAARSIASRIADELASPLGTLVGYKVRFSDTTRPSTLIKLMTDGMLLAEAQSNPSLGAYEVLIIDEAHERSLNIDFLLGILKGLLTRRSDLRLVITSATIDVDRFGAYFSRGGRPAPVIRVSGRSHPIEIRYRPLLADSAREALDLSQGIDDALAELALDGQGHVLVFVPTERDIREIARQLRRKRPGGDAAGRTEILPLYARLSAAEQGRIFRDYPFRRIVLATNIAESSLTVPGIRYVVDAGTARISRYSARSKVQRLPIEAISRASADQRAGRCGRVGPGICIRLYSQADYQARKEFTVPEIQRTNLAAVILRALALGLGRVEEFPFLDPPKSDAIQDGYRTLFEIGALDDQRTLTACGHVLARMPVDPRIGRILLAGRDEGCLRELLVIAAALEVQDPRERPLDRQEAADARHAQFRDERSDFVGLLKLWDAYHVWRAALGRNRLQRACSDNFLSFARMREWSEMQRQLQEIMRDLDRPGAGHGKQGSRDAEPVPQSEPEDLGDPSPAHYRAIHRALLTGFLWGVGWRKTPVEYLGAGGRTFFLWPGSGTFDRKPLWCLVAELIETSRRYGRMVAAIQPEWVEPLADHLVQRSYSEPHWHRRNATVMAFERVTLFGLPLVARRRVPYGKIDPETSREVFLREGLRHEPPALESALERWHVLAADQKRLAETHVRIDRLTQEPFFRHNDMILARIAKLAAKCRRVEALIDDLAIWSFYSRRVPPDVYDLASLQRWLRNMDDREGRALQMDLDSFGDRATEGKLDEEFPEHLEFGSMRLPVDYHFAPGATHDGVTVLVPSEGLRQLHAGITGWLVPGLLEEKITALIRSLPKAQRTSFIPAPDVARRVRGMLRFGQGDFLREVVRCLNCLGSQQVAVEDFDVSRLPPHLSLNVQVVDVDGRLGPHGRDVEQLAREAAAPTRAIEPSQPDPWQREGITTWDFGELHAEQLRSLGGFQITVFPALVDRGDTVSLAILDHPLEACAATRAGIRRLYVLQQRRRLDSQVPNLPQWKEMNLWAVGLMTPDNLKSDVRDLLADRAFLTTPDTLPRTQGEFQSRLENAVERISLAAQDVARLLPKIFERYQGVRLALEADRRGTDEAMRADVIAQLSQLLVPHFLLETPWEWLQEYPRYLAAIQTRLGRPASGKDGQQREALARLWREYLRLREMADLAGREEPELRQLRWMFEELRVSFFAQSLGTRCSVSVAKLQKWLARWK